MRCRDEQMREQFVQNCTLPSPCVRPVVYKYCTYSYSSVAVLNHNVMSGRRASRRHPCARSRRASRRRGRTNGARRASPAAGARAGWAWARRPR